MCRMDENCRRAYRFERDVVYAVSCTNDSSPYYKSEWSSLLKVSSFKFQSLFMNYYRLSYNICNTANSKCKFKFKKKKLKK